MSNFWAQRLGTPQAPAQAAPVAPAATGPWWAPQQPLQANPQPPAVPAQPYTPASQRNGEQHFGDLLQQDTYTSTKAQSAKDTERCPDCQSGNFIAPQGHPNAVKQCFDCGYNTRFLHSTHGISATNSDDPVIHTARAQMYSENNFNPQKIVGHVTV